MKTRLFLALTLAAFTVVSSCKKNENPAVVVTATYDSNEILRYSCDSLDHIVSASFQPSVQMNFVNGSSKWLRVDWINFAGELTNYQEKLLPGNTYQISSFVNHYWYISDEDGNCIGIYAATNASAAKYVNFADQ